MNLKKDSISSVQQNNVYKPKYPVQTIEKTIKIIDFLKNNSTLDGLSLSEISSGVEMPISGVHRILDTLFAYNYVERGEKNNYYKLGWELFEVGKNIPQQHSIAASNYMHLLETLCNKYGETVNLGILSSQEVVVLDRIEPKNPDMRLMASIQIGGRSPLYLMSMGKLFLSDMTDNEIRQYYDSHNIIKLTNRTIATPEQMMAECSKIRLLGYATEMEEYCEALGCVATPIRNHTGKIVAAISISCAVNHLDSTRLSYILPDMKDACAEISRKLGYKNNR